MHTSTLNRLHKVQDHILKQLSANLKEAEKNLKNLENLLKKVKNHIKEEQKFVSGHPEYDRHFSSFAQNSQHQINQMEVKIQNEKENIEKILDEMRENIKQKKAFEVLK